MSDLIRREDAIKAIHNYWMKRLDTLPTKESEYGEVYADIQQMDKILVHNKTLCNFIEAIPSAQPTVDAITVEYIHRRIETLNEYISKWGGSFEHEEMVNAYIHEVSALVRLVNDWRKEE